MTYEAAKVKAKAARAARDAEVLHRAADGQSERTIAAALGVSRTTVWQIKQSAKAAVR